MNRLPVLGIDPGHDGAGFLLGADGTSPLGRWQWHRLGRSKKRYGRRAWRLTTAEGTGELPTLGAVGVCIVGGLVRYGVRPGGYVLVVEGLFGRGDTLRILGEEAGAVYGPLEAGAANELEDYRPRSQTWRRQVLGIDERAMGAEGAEQAARRLVGALLKPYDTALHEAIAGPGGGHLAEAYCIARCGWVTVRQRAMETPHA
jgi:hypothetical protein